MYCPKHKKETRHCIDCEIEEKDAEILSLKEEVSSLKKEVSSLIIQIKDDLEQEIKRIKGVRR